MKNKILHSIFSSVLTIIILLPFTIQAVHAFHNHEYKICVVKDIKHIHQHNIDCSSFHQIIEHNSIDFSTGFSLEIRLFSNQNPTYYHQSLYTIGLQLKASRAPPYFIV